MAYKHGIFTENVGAAGRLGVRSLGTVPVYVGTAPVFMTDSTTDKINKPILISSFNDFVSMLGYSDKWSTFTLCEAAYAHFKNDIQAVSPIIVVNIFDPTKHIADTDGSATVTFTNKVGYIDNANNDIIASTLASTTTGVTGFTKEYTSDNKIKITLPSTSTATSATFTYSTASVAKVTATDFENGLKAIDLSAIRCGVVPNILVAPVFSESYYSQMIAKCTAGIDGKWACVAYVDISTTNTTIDTAISDKTTKAITSKYARAHYPMAKRGGRVYHLSVLDAVATQLVDAETDGVSCHSSSNRRTMCDVPVLNSTTDLIYSESDANKLNANGITTLNYIGGAFRIWGGHMANYSYSAIDSIDPKDRSDATVRMQLYLDNWLKATHIDHIDAPLTRRDIDNIVSSVNIGLNSFVNSGYLLKGECYFDGGNNSTSELADGNLVLDVLHTEVPNGKSINFRLSYDISGLEALYETEEV